MDTDVLGGRGLATGYVFFYVRKDTEAPAKGYIGGIVEAGSREG